MWRFAPVLAFVLGCPGGGPLAANDGNIAAFCSDLDDCEQASTQACIDTQSHARDVADAAGCTDEYQAYLGCANHEGLACAADPYAHVASACADEQRADADCQAAYWQQRCDGDAGRLAERQQQCGLTVDAAPSTCNEAEAVALRERATCYESTPCNALASCN